MSDISILDTSATAKRYQSRYEQLMATRAKAKDAEDTVTPSPDAPADVPSSDPAPTDTGANLPSYVQPFSGVVNAMGLDMFMPNGGSAVTMLNQTLQSVSALSLNSDLAAQLLGLQSDQPPSQDATPEAALQAIGQKYDVTQGPQSLFAQLDTDNDGYVMPWDLQKAVADGGGSTSAAAALYAQLDPFGNGDITEQQFVANLPQMGATEPTAPAPGVADANANDTSAFAGLYALGRGLDLSQPLQNVFQELDTNFDGVLSQSDIEQAVVAGGGSPEAGAALFAQLDPNNTGVVTQGQFASNLVPRIDIPTFI